MAVDVKKNILFSVKQTGSAKAARGFGNLASSMKGAALKAGIAGAAILLVGKQIADTIKSAQRFQTVINSITTNMTEFNARTAGMIDTMVSVQKAAELERAGLMLAKDEMAALGVVTAQAAQAAGEGPEGATTRFNKLVKAVIRGSEGPLLQYGIQLDETTDKTKAQAEAIAKLTEKAEGLSVKIKTGEEAFNAFSNSLGTVVDFEIAAATKGINELTMEIFGSAEALTLWEQDLVATNGQLAENYSLLTDADTILATHNETLMEAVEAGESNWIIQGRLIQQNVHVSDSTLNNARAYLKEKQAIERTLEAKRKLKLFNEGQKKRQGDFSKQSAEVDKLRGLMETLNTSGSSKELKRAYEQAEKLLGSSKFGHSVDLFDFADAYQRSHAQAIKNEKFARSLSGGGGGGRRSAKRAAPEGDPFADVDIFDPELLEDDPVTAKMKDEEARAAIEAERYRQEVLAELEAEQAEKQRLAMLQKEDDQRNHLAILLNMETEHQNQLREQWQQSADFRVNSTKLVINSMGAMLNNLSQAQDADTKRGFKRKKALDYSSNMISTISGATGAFSQAVASIPPPAGPIVGAAQAATMAALGAVNGNKIRTQKFGSGAVKPAKAKAPSFNAGSLGGTGGGQNQTINMSFVLNGQTIQRQQIEANQVAAQNGEQSFAMRQD